MSKRKLSLDSGQKETAVRDIFSGNTYLPRIDHAVKMAACLGCGVEDFFGILPLQRDSRPIVPYENLLRECVHVVVNHDEQVTYNEEDLVLDLYEWCLMQAALGVEISQKDIYHHMLYLIKKASKYA